MPKTAEVLNPESPRWNQFADALDAVLVNETCDGDRRHRHARRLMSEMGNIDIEKSIALFESRGGYCDCEILFNVDPDGGRYMIAR